MKNEKFTLDLSDEGTISALTINKDKHQMNWVVSEGYLKEAGFFENEKDKLFGNFTLVVNGKNISDQLVTPTVSKKSNKAIIIYSYPKILDVIFIYNLSETDHITWTIKIRNKSPTAIKISEFSVWASLAYVMFRENDLNLQTNHSTAVFPAISKSFTKLACVRRSNDAPHLGIFQLEGETQSVGTYCCYENLFFENVSPSLDGILFHKLMLAGGYPKDFENADWIYAKEGLTLASGKDKVWKYAFDSFENQDDFYQVSKKFKHPLFELEPMAIQGAAYNFSCELSSDQILKEAIVEYLNNKNERIKENITHMIEQKGAKLQGSLNFTECGEHKISIVTKSGHVDSIIVNVMKPIGNIIKERVDYISNTLYNDAKSATPHAYSPISNQGESLGKLSLVLKKNLMDETLVEEVRKVEASCVNYIRPKWFSKGNFSRPNNLYGNFYRCMDFEYTGHIFYLLSLFDDDILLIHSRNTYLDWAAEVFCLRVDPGLHESERGKEESQMLGVFFLYIEDLLAELKNRGLTKKYELINTLWKQSIQNVANQSQTLKAAVTEHFYDNAGFGPATGALANANHLEAAKKYGELLVANIGFSNDFRAQNPDRWWEALSYMIHSLWGGITAAATLLAYEKLEDVRLLKASYRATVAMLYCYDVDAKATSKKLTQGEAASTYSVAGPHLNRPDLSRNRFGQSTFFQDGGIFSKLFSHVEEISDWDMGEELVAYLAGFGKKTFLYLENGELKVINGSLEKIAEGYIVHSFAPYCSEYHFYEKGQHFIAEGQKVIPAIRYINNKFIVM